MNRIMDFQDSVGTAFQLFKDEFDGEVFYTIATDAIDVSELHQGCFWCHVFESWGDALAGIEMILDHANSDGKVDLDWIVDYFGMATC